MIEYIEGKLAEKNPTYMVIDCGGVGYFINVSLHTYSQVPNTERCKLLICQIIREDAHILYGFATEEERSLFKLLISVSGVGANTGRMILSSLKPVEIHSAIMTGNYVILKGIKGIGEKTAQRIVIELKDKFGKGASIIPISFSQDNKTKNEALSALVMLGFSKAPAEKVIDQIIIKDGNLTVEELIKQALNKL